MRRLVAACLFGTFLILNQGILAYEIDTHEKLSEAATSRSVLKTDSVILHGLGLQFSIEDDRQQFPGSDGKPKNILNLIKAGARFEDGLTDCDPRPRNHFYDPRTGLGMRRGLITGEPSPDWALEDKRDIGGQEFSYKNARKYFYDALTATTSTVRDSNFGLTFQSLGHVIHHVQDMAQPQHVRNDIHLNIGECWLKKIFGVLENPSLYEQWTKGRADLPFTDPNYNQGKSVVFTTPRMFWTGDGRGLAEFTNSNFVSAGTNYQLRNGQVAPNATYPQPIPLVGESIHIRDLLKEESKTTDLDGYVDFVANSVTDALTGETKPNPRSASVSIFDQDLKTYNKTVTYDTSDPLDPSFNIQVTTDRALTLNRFNFKKAHEFLIPRAVAYSTGLLDYFFRGKLEVQDADFTDTGISLRLSNAIDYGTQPAWKDETLNVGGTLTLAYEYRLNGKAEYGVANNTATLSTPLAPGRTSDQVYNFTLPEIPDTATDVKYRLVYRGKIGQEENAVAVGAVKPASGFLVTPNYAPADRLSAAGQKRLIYYRRGQWHLSKDTTIEAGNIDWKGWYVNNKPTKVLSWIGPPARYFPEREEYNYTAQRRYSYSTFGNAIYQGGEIFAVAPANVLGAAVVRDSKGFDWLIVVCAEDRIDVAYRRPHKKSASAALYDPVNEPEGWEKIGISNPAEGDPAGSFTQAADIPWFFNGPGTEAQTIRRWWSGSIYWRDGLLKRLKLELRNDVTTAVFTIENRGDEGFVEERACNASYDQYGAGSGQYTSNSRGEYTFAVDYKNTKPVFGKIRIEASTSKQSTVSVSHDHEPNQHYKDVLTGLTQVGPSYYREYLVLDAGELLTFSDVYDAYATSWTSGATTPTYRRTITRRMMAHEITYFIDLRADQYAYYFYNFTDHDQVVDSVESSAEDGNEGSKFIRNGIFETLHSNSFPHYATNRSAYGRLYEVRCGSSSVTIHRYGTSNFGWWSWYGQALGSAAIDLEGRQAHSQRVLADFGYDEVGTANTLSGSSLQSVIPGAPSSGAFYYPIDIVR